MRNRVLIGFTALALSALLVSCTPDPARMGEPLADPENGFWFEMQNQFSGEWDPVILVFGYADDKSVCDWMVSVGREENPGRQFRCTTVSGSVIHFP